MNYRLLLALVLCTVSVPVLARDSQLDVMLGDSYFEANLDGRWPRESSYLLTGIGGVYRDWDDKLYRMLHGTIGFGSDSIIEGLGGEIGLRGFTGQVDRGRSDGSARGLGLKGALIYTLPKQLGPIPIDCFADLIVAPSFLSGGSLDDYREYGIGAHFWLFEKTALTVAYRDRKFDMERGWKLSDGIFSVGLGLSF